MKVDVSVVIPIFGDFDLGRLSVVIDSVKAQEGIRAEIVVSEQAFESRLDVLKSKTRITHVLVSPEIKNGKPAYNAGKARNVGMRVTCADYVYFNDADIVFHQKDFLSSLWGEIKEGEILIRPAMRRMLVDEVADFLKLRADRGWEYAASKIRLNLEYLATLADNHEPLQTVIFNDRIFTSTAFVLKKYEADLSLRGNENLIWQRIVHCGAIFGKKADIESVGGYSCDYPVCVYEDSDLQWKLGEKFKVRQLGENRLYEVIHLDHAMPYRSKEHEVANKVIFERRKKAGVKKAIGRDQISFLQKY